MMAITTNNSIKVNAPRRPPRNPDGREKGLALNDGFIFYDCAGLDFERSFMANRNGLVTAFYFFCSPRHPTKAWGRGAQHQPASSRFTFGA